MFSLVIFFHGILGVTSLAANLISLTILYRCSYLSKTALGVCLTNLAVNQFGFAIFGHLTIILPSQIAEHWVWGSDSCNLFGFLKSYFQVVILSCVVVLCVERYLKREETLRLRFYRPSFFFKISIGLWLYSAIWAFLPFIGWGSYERKDYTCDVVMIPRDGEWKDFSYALVFSFATFLVPSAIMFHLLGKARKTTILWKVNQKHSWIDSPQIFKTTMYMSTCIFLLFCAITLIGFVDWIPNSVSGEQTFYFETVHSMFFHLLAFMNPLFYLIGVSTIRRELLTYKGAVREGKKTSTIPLIERKTSREKVTSHFSTVKTKAAEVLPTRSSKR